MPRCDQPVDVLKHLRRPFEQSTFLRKSQQLVIVFERAVEGACVKAAKRLHDGAFKLLRAREVRRATGVSSRFRSEADGVVDQVERFAIATRARLPP